MAFTRTLFLCLGFHGFLKFTFVSLSKYHLLGPVALDNDVVDFTLARLVACKAIACRVSSMACMACEGAWQCGVRGMRGYANSGWNFRVRSD